MVEPDQIEALVRRIGDGTGHRIGYEDFLKCFGDDIKARERGGVGVSLHLRPGERAENEEPRPRLRVERFRERDAKAYHDWHQAVANYRHDRHCEAEKMLAYVGSEDHQASCFPGRGHRFRQERQAGVDPITSAPYLGDANPAGEETHPSPASSGWWEAEPILGFERDLRKQLFPEEGRWWESPTLKDPWVNNPVRKNRGCFSPAFLGHDW